MYYYNSMTDRHNEKFRSPGRPLKGAEKRVRMSFTLSPRQVQWIQQHSKQRGQSNSETIEAALARYEDFQNRETPTVRQLVSKYPLIFWDVESQAVEDGRHADFIIERMLEAGTLAGVRDLLSMFAPGRIAEVIKHSRRISVRTAKFWQVYLGIEGRIRCLEEEY